MTDTAPAIPPRFLTASNAARLLALSERTLENHPTGVAALTTDRPAAARRLEIQAWAAIHGLALLTSDGPLPADGQIIEEVVDQTTQFDLSRMPSRQSLLLCELEPVPCPVQKVAEMQRP